jgi:hypothetical protein
MPEFVTKTIQIRKCRRCQSIWAAEPTTLDVQEQIVFMTVTIAHCPACSDSFAAEVDRPTYRRTGKKIQ